MFYEPVVVAEGVEEVNEESRDFKISYHFPFPFYLFTIKWFSRFRRDMSLCWFT
jgi:hypothetical protein